MSISSKEKHITRAQVIKEISEYASFQELRLKK